MKNTLYQILGVDPKASLQQIEAAYAMRLEELKVATIRDPNKLIVLQQCREILCDANQRATYDASIAVRASPEPALAEEPESTFVQRWGKWIAAALVVIVAGLLWAKHGSPPPAQKAPLQAVAPNTPASPAPPEPAANVPAAVTAPAAAVAQPVANVPAIVSAPAAVVASQPAETPVSPVAGEWSCDDAITGHTSKYNFQKGGELSIATSDGQHQDLKYELDGSSLKIADSKQTSVDAIEELGPRKMILNTGAGGRRLVCKR
jgi:hypothetical protein